MVNRKLFISSFFQKTLIKTKVYKINLSWLADGFLLFIGLFICHLNTSLAGLLIEIDQYTTITVDDNSMANTVHC